MIEIKNVFKTYNLGKTNAFTALKDVTLTIHDGEMVAIIGKSGAGKSTLMHILGCIDDFEKGEYHLNGEDISKTNEKKRAEIRNKEIGIVLQDFALMEQYSVIENVLMPLYFTKNAGKKRAREIKALDILKQLEMEELADKKVNKLSGGQKQRVAIARTLYSGAKVLCFDDSLSAVDSLTDANIRKELHKRVEGITTIIISQRVNTLMEADKILVLDQGRIVQEGTHDQLANQPGIYREIVKIQSDIIEQTKQEAKG